MPTRYDVTVRRADGLKIKHTIAAATREAAEARALREKQLRVVHGKGMGVLRRTLRDYLKTDKNVDSFHDAEANQGGHGVTIVNVKA